MKARIRTFHNGLFAKDIKTFTALYNRTQCEQHGFFPITTEQVRERITCSPWFDPQLLFFAEVDGQAVGFAHAANLRAPCHQEGGVIEAMGVLPACRGEGIGGHLLDEALQRLADRDVHLIDAGGTFPFSPFYSTWLDGSERSGPSVDNAPAVQLFASRDFTPVRTSEVMRAPLSTIEAPARTGTMQLVTRPRRDYDNWLDHVFRGWSLVDSQLTGPLGRQALSRAIYGRMDQLCEQEGRELYAVFGVRTPEALRGHGYATAHFRKLLSHLAEQGGEVAELHVFSDNKPALRLYRRVGFVRIGETVTLRRSL